MYSINSRVRSAIRREIITSLLDHDDFVAPIGAGTLEFLPGHGTALELVDRAELICRAVVAAVSRSLVHPGRAVDVPGPRRPGENERLASRARAPPGGACGSPRTAASTTLAARTGGRAN